MASCTPYEVQHMSEYAILSLETTARCRPENLYQPARQWGWRQALSSHLAEAILRAKDWHQSKRKSLPLGTQLFSKIEGAVPAPLQEQSAAPALFALSESPVDRMAPSPFDITSAAVQPMDCRRSEVPIVLQSKTRSGNTAIRRQNVIN